MSAQALIHYRVRWKPKGNWPGATRGVAAGVGDQQRSVVLLRDYPDPRRLDLRASMRDPFEHLWVRDFNLNAALNVIVLIDTSASMGYCGAVSRMAVVQDIASQLALAVYRHGDAFGLFAASETVQSANCLPPRVNRGAWLWVQQHVNQIRPKGQHIAGLHTAVAQLPQRKCLVFLLSDFRWGQGQLKQMLKKLQRHDVIPMVLQDPAELEAMPKRGFAMVRDLETGEGKFVWMRPALHQKIRATREAHLKQVSQICQMYGTRPFVVKGEFQPDQLTRYFIERAGV